MASTNTPSKPDRGEQLSDERLAQLSKETDLEAYIRKVVDTAPPLSPEQKNRLAVLLRGRRVQR